MPEWQEKKKNGCGTQVIKTRPPKHNNALNQTQICLQGVPKHPVSYATDNHQSPITNDFNA